ncbi:hypothetical protein DFA_11651 [Cavenderia fasciculata]|uniref:Uncharacterized protein n=1 Tax=Cavenderia fasciculata TaxID=261658 RepID=F4QDU3_CACFS|nr:uncharacterized protein DFA_11651 [Cavenderia fasciculata]EGG13890.1 hypothetical protein DFA_11651 [Cavenderia fasciculata]|eukprot:XP_004350598.1 hypothetical protein DFA_11651 [Cavenderia fasciculata]
METNILKGIKIYVDHNKTTIKGINLQMTLARFFLHNNVHRSLISIYDIADDFEKQGAIKNHSKKIPRYPYIEICGKLWGEGWSVEENKEEVLELIQPLMNLIQDNQDSEVVEAFLNNKELSKETLQQHQQSEELALGYIDSGINITEWLLFGAVKGLWNTAWQSTGDQLETQDEDVEFECQVIRTNWYGRHQFRQYRFTPYMIQRLHDGAVKATLFYNDIKEVICTDKKNIIIKIQNSEDQYIEGLEKDIGRIIDIVTSRAYLRPNEDNTCWVSAVIA